MGTQIMILTSGGVRWLVRAPVCYYRGVSGKQNTKTSTGGARMPAIVVVVIVLIAFFLAYRFYSRYLTNKVYALDKDFQTPAHEFEDGVDYVPTNKHVLFGHHFTSVAGAAPIVGPAIAVFWGWVPALLWVVLGTIFAAGVHDFGSLVVSVRNRAQNIGTLTSSVINARSRTLFLLIIFFLLTLVNAVFAVVMAILFESSPGAVIPAVLIIPIAIAVGQLAYRSRMSLLVPTIVGVGLLYAFIPVGQMFPITVDPLASALGWDVRTTWVVLIFAYTWVASRLPVWLLLQPRDYLNSYQLFIALGVIFLGVAVGFDRIVAPALNTNLPEGSPNWFPFLFITIACGAISGFHSLVASGTSSKQLDNETDARYVGYMGALGEGSLALASILACTAGIGALAVWQDKYTDFGTASDGAVGNFTEGVGHFASNLGIPAETGAIFAAVVVITFAGTTMDTGIRLQRYIIQEIGEIVRIGPLTRNITLTTTIGVAIPLGLALFPGGGETGGFVFGSLWRLFGTTNQLTAGLALSIVAVWVFTRGRNPLAQIVPLTFLLIMTTWALFIQLGEFFQEGNWLLTILDAVIFVLALWLIIEAIGAFRRAQQERRSGGS
jgi:carbon starvation protein